MRWRRDSLFLNRFISVHRLSYYCPCYLLEPPGRYASHSANFKRQEKARTKRNHFSGERVLAIANFSCQFVPSPRGTTFKRKDRFGATPKPTRETRALPKSRRPRRDVSTLF